MSYLLILVIVVEAMITITYITMLMIRLVDTANYSCVAANSARQRTSPAALVTVYSKFNVMMIMMIKVMMMMMMMTKKKVVELTL